MSGALERLLIPMRGILRHPLTRRRRLLAFVRVLAWQLRSRLQSSVDLAFVNAARLRVSRGMTGLTGNVYTGLHEFESMGFLLHLLRRDELFVDIGANAGSYTVLAGAALGCRVIAIEPSTSALEALRANVELNAMADRVDVHAVIVADTPGTLPFTCRFGAANHVATADDPIDDVLSLPVQTLDAIIGRRLPVLIKLDVEGYELKVLRGASSTLATPQLCALIVEINGSDQRYQLQAKDLVLLLRCQGFEGYAYDPVRRALTHVDPLLADGNVIFIRDRAEVERRLVAAPAFHLPGWNLSI